MRFAFAGSLDLTGRTCSLWPGSTTGLCSVITSATSHSRMQTSRRFTMSRKAPKVAEGAEVFGRHVLLRSPNDTLVPGHRQIVLRFKARRRLALHRERSRNGGHGVSAAAVIRVAGTDHARRLTVG